MSNVEFPTGMLVGLELEFCTPQSVSPFEFNELFRDKFSLGTDSSLNPRSFSARMLEVRSYPSRVVEFEPWFLLLLFLKDQRAFITHSCGLHVHLSWDILHATLLFGAIVTDLVPKVTVFPGRDIYCSKTFNSSKGVRYNALRWVDLDSDRGHFEVRVFNGTLKMRGIFHWVKRLQMLAQKVESNSQACGFTVNTQPRMNDMNLETRH